MILLIQRVSAASVSIEDKKISEIAQGIMALVAIEKQDHEKIVIRLLQRLLNYRIFPDLNGRMNLSLRDIHGDLLLVPQFTLAADTRQGNRPSFTPAAAPELGQYLFDYFVTQAKSQYQKVENGRFGANMQVSLINDGPVTFSLKG